MTTRNVESGFEAKDAFDVGCRWGWGVDERSEGKRRREGA
jgi:hypothetical protein